MTAPVINFTPPTKGHSTDLYVVYEKPTDFPDSFVVRRHRVTAEGGVPDKAPLLIHKKLEVIQVRLRVMGLVNIGRFPQDDPAIKEVWI